MIESSQSKNLPVVTIRHAIFDVPTCGEVGADYHGLSRADPNAKKRCREHCKIGMLTEDLRPEHSQSVIQSHTLHPALAFV